MSRLESEKDSGSTAGSNGSMHVGPQRWLFWLVLVCFERFRASPVVPPRQLRLVWKPPLLVSHDCIWVCPGPSNCTKGDLLSPCGIHDSEEAQNPMMSLATECRSLSPRLGADNDQHRSAHYVSNDVFYTSMDLSLD
jgi:hypothetical protein